MRTIGIGRVKTQLPGTWEKRAAAALAEVEAAPADQRSEMIDKHAALWRELATLLGSLSHKKCWYCEAREDRSDKSVDHFRPKSRVAERPDHGGYWWLAFEWTNYRFSCTFCNARRRDKQGNSTGGKHDHFPLLDEAARAFQSDAIAGESPALLDPTNAADTTLLYCTEEGRVVPRGDKDAHKVHFIRAEASIELYHLNHTDAVEARVELYRAIKQLVDVGRTFFDDWSAGNASAKQGYTFVTAQLQELVQERAEFSASARDIILGFRDNRHPWIDALV